MIIALILLATVGVACVINQLTPPRIRAAWHNICDQLGI